MATRAACPRTCGGANEPDPTRPGPAAALYTCAHQVLTCAHQMLTGSWQPTSLFGIIALMFALIIVTNDAASHAGSHPNTTAAEHYAHQMKEIPLFRGDTYAHAWCLL